MSVNWELGYDQTEADFGLENRDDLDAINRTIVTYPQTADLLLSQKKITKSSYNKFQELYQDWKKFYKVIIDSWYVSDDDLNLAKKKRDDINMTLHPVETKQVQKYSAQAAGMTKEEAGQYEKETKSFLQRNWLPVAIGVFVLGAGTYLTGTIAPLFMLVKRRH